MFKEKLFNIMGLCVLVVSFLMLAVSANAQVIIDLEASASSVDLNETFTVMVKVEAGTDDIDAAQVNLSFDPNVFQVQSVTQFADIPTPFVGPTIDNMNGSVLHLRTKQIVGANLTGSLDFMEVEFLAVAAMVNSEISVNFDSDENLSTIVTLAGVDYIGQNLANINEEIVTVNGPDVDIIASPQGGTSLQVGDQFSVDVSIASGVQIVDAAEVTLSFDPMLMQALSATADLSAFNIVFSSPQVIIDNTAGTISYSGGTFTSPFAMGTFKIFDVTFEATAISAGTDIAFSFTGPFPTNVYTNTVDLIDDPANDAIGVSYVISDNDADEDGVADDIDNCPSTANADQLDTDGDGTGDVCDDDDDNDGVLDGDDLDSLNPAVCQDLDGDGCDDCSAGVDGFGPLADNNTANDGTDTDSDGICDSGDACPNDANKTEAGACGCGGVDVDSDLDGTSDCVDECPNDPNLIIAGPCGCDVIEVDTDGDGTFDCVDEDDDNDGVLDVVDGDPLNPFVCQDLDGDGCDDCTAGTDGFGPLADFNPNLDGNDTDGDGICNTSDGCVFDPNKVEPGDCGCGVVDVDTDGDGKSDCIDDCPNDPNKTEVGDCGCGVVDVDTDLDGTSDCIDLCINDPNKIEPGICGCGVEDLDTDEDGIFDCDDLDDDDDGCADLVDPNPLVASLDSDSDTVGDDCDICFGDDASGDTDNDGTCDDLDLCDNDPNKVAPGDCGCGAEDVDTDLDGTFDCNDLCPNDPNKSAPGVCGCGVEDLDTDEDGILDCVDNCPLVANPLQTDADSDNYGEACDCFDNIPEINPGATEIPNNNIDENCDGIKEFNQINDVTISIGDAIVPVATEFELQVIIDAGGQPVAASDINLSFDPTVVEVLEVVNGTTLPITVLSQVSSGQVIYSASTFSSAPTGTFTLCTLRFRALSPSAGSPLTFGAGTLAAHLGNELNSVINSGNVIVENVTALDAQVELQRGSYLAPHPTWEVPVDIAFYQPGTDTEVFRATNVMLDNTGAFSLPRVPRGVFDIAVKNEHTLQKVLGSVDVVAPLSILDIGILLEGDSDDDNDVDGVDLSILSSSFGLAQGISPGYDDRADLNEDKTISILDFGLLSINYLKIGDEVPLPPVSEIPDERVEMFGKKVQLSTPSEKVITAPGENISVPILMNSAEIPVDGVDISLSFDPEKVQLSVVSFSDKLPFVIMQEINNEKGILHIAIGNIAGDYPTAENLVGTLEFSIESEFTGSVFLNDAASEKIEVSSGGQSVFDSFSDLLVVESRSSNAAKSALVYPNPFVEKLYLEVDGFEVNDELSLEVTDNLGREWQYEQSVKVSGAYKEKIEVGSDDMPRGVYYLSIKHEKSGFQKKMKVIKI